MSAGARAPCKPISARVRIAPTPMSIARPIEPIAGDESKVEQSL
jgi:hypothetical protein